MAQSTTFSGKFGFLMAAIGSAVGLGNIWSFPSNAASSGGSAFVIATLIFSFLIAYPVVVSEFALGRAIRGSLTNIFVKAAHKPSQQKYARFAAWVMIFNVSAILSFYAIVGGWVLAHGLKPLLTHLGYSEFYTMLEANSGMYNAFFMTFFLALCFFISRMQINKGLEKASSWMMPTLFFSLLALVAYNITLPEAQAGFAFYLMPNLDKLLDPQVLMSALGQSFFSVTAGLGIMVVYGAYVRPDVYIPKYAKLIVIADVLVAFVAGLVVIPAMYVAQSKGIPIFDANGQLHSGTTLVFDVLPTLFEHMGMMGYVLSGLFFVSLLIAGITSSISILEVPVSKIEKDTQLSRSQAASVSTVLIYAASLVICFNVDALLDLVIKITTGYIAPLGAIFICILTTWMMKPEQFATELGRAGANASQSRLLFNYIKWICPLIITAILIYTNFF